MRDYDACECLCVSVCLHVFLCVCARVRVFVSKTQTTYVYGLGVRVLGFRIRCVRVKRSRDIIVYYLGCACDRSGMREN